MGNLKMANTVVTYEFSELNKLNARWQLASIYHSLKIHGVNRCEYNVIYGDKNLLYKKRNLTFKKLDFTWELGLNILYLNE